MARPKYVKEFEFPSSAGFHGSAGVQHVRGYARGGKPKETGAQRAKVGKVLGEFKSGELRSGSKTGPVVTNPKQAQAIALSEAGLSKPNLQARMKKPGGYAKGGKVADAKQDKAVVKKAVHQHEKAQHPGEPLTRLKKGGYPAHRGAPKLGCGK